MAWARILVQGYWLNLCKHTSSVSDTPVQQLTTERKYSRCVVTVHLNPGCTACLCASPAVLLQCAGSWAVPVVSSNSSHCPAMLAKPRGVTTSSSSIRRRAGAAAAAGCAGPDGPGFCCCHALRDGDQCAAGAC
jgi:hypothetical protein